MSYLRHFFFFLPTSLPPGIFQRNPTLNRTSKGPQIHLPRPLSLWNPTPLPCTLGITRSPETSGSFTLHIPSITQFHFLNFSLSHPIFSLSTMPTSPGPTQFCGCGCLMGICHTIRDHSKVPAKPHCSHHVFAKHIWLHHHSRLHLLAACSLQVSIAPSSRTCQGLTLESAV